MKYLVISIGDLKIRGDPCFQRYSVKNKIKGETHNGKLKRNKKISI